MAVIELLPRGAWGRRTAGGGNRLDMGGMTGHHDSVIETIDVLARGVIALPPDQRFTLAQRILASVEPEGDLGTGGAWVAETFSTTR